MLEQLNKKSKLLGIIPQDEAEAHLSILTNKYHHSSLRKGYVKKGLAEVYFYKGRMGEGLMIAKHNTNSNSYVWVDYYLKDNK